MKVIGLLNEKGGVGKTTLSTYLAVGLAKKGFNVLFIDATPQADATSSLGMAEEPGFYNLVLRDADWSDVWRSVPADVWGGSDNDGMLLGIPSNWEASLIGQAITFEKTLAFRMKMNELSENYAFDFVIFDTQPNPTNAHDPILYSCDHVIIPTEAESFAALRGVASTVKKIADIRRQGESVGLDIANLLGIQPNRIRNVGLHEAFIKNLREHYPGKVLPSVKERIAIAESQLANQFLYNIEQELKATRDMWRYVESVMVEIGVSV